MNRIQTPRRLSVSSWSLRRALGEPEFYGVGGEIPTASHDRGAISLLDLPRKLADFGIHTVEICHFHLPSRDADYLRQLRENLQNANVEFWSLLVDDGDISDEEHGARDAKWIESWFPIAQSLGAKCVRVIAGKGAPTNENLERSARLLHELAQKARMHDLRLMTENWFGVLSTPERVLELFERTRGELGLCFDFGNWPEENKIEMLRQIAPLAESCHAKAEFFDSENLDVEDYTHCLDLLQKADFSGPFTLINGTPGDEWRGLQIEKAIVQRYL